MSPHAVLSDTTSVTSPTPFSPFSSFSVSSEATVVSDQGDQADLGAFQSVFFALSQLQLHHSQQSTGHSQPHRNDHNAINDFTRSNTPSVHPMSPLTLDPLSSHPPSRSRFNPDSSSSSSTDTEFRANHHTATMDGESDVVLAAKASSSSAAEDGDEESLALTSPNSHPSSDDVSVPEEYDGTQDDREGGDGPRQIWTYTEISPYERSFRSSDSPGSDNASPLLEDSLGADGDDDGPSLGDLESAFAFFATERAKLAKQLEVGKIVSPPSFLPALPVGNARRIGRRGGKGHKKSGSKNTLASLVSGSVKHIPESDETNLAGKALVSSVSSSSKVLSSSELDDSFDARKQQNRGVLPRPPKHILKATKTSIATVPLATPNNHRQPGNHRHSRSLPIDAHTVTSLQAQTSPLVPTPASEVVRIQSLARRLTFQFPHDAPSLRRVIADPEMAMGLGSHATPSDDVLVADGFFDPIYGADGMTPGNGMVATSLNPDARAALLYVFIDHSNILVGFLEWLKHQNHPSLPGSKRSPKPKLSHAALVLLLERGRKCQRRVLVASSPLYQSLDEIAGMGYQISVLQRVEIKEGASSASRHKRTGSGLGTITPSASTTTLGGASPAGTPSRSQQKKGKGRAGGKAGAPIISVNAVNDDGSTESDSAGQKQQQPNQQQQQVVVNRLTRRAAQQHHRRMSSTDQVFITSSNSTTSLATNNTPGSNDTGSTPASRPRFREEAVDELLQLKLLQTLLDTPSPPPPGSTIILASGDAARSQFNPQGFLGCVRKAVERGWNVEVVGWEEGRSRAYGELAAEVEKGDVSGSELGGKLSIVGLDRWGLDLVET